MSVGAQMRQKVATVADENITQHVDVVAFLAARMRSDRRWTRDRCTGISSDALTFHGVGDPEPGPGSYPADLGDLMACERTYLMAPDEVRERMLPVLEKYREHVYARQEKYAAEEAAR